jgi:chemotaxis protein MotA
MRARTTAFSYRPIAGVIPAQKAAEAEFLAFGSEPFGGSAHPNGRSTRVSPPAFLKQSNSLADKDSSCRACDWRGVFAGTGFLAPQAGRATRSSGWAWWKRFAMRPMRFAVDKSTLGGILVALLGLGLGLILDGGRIAQVIQPTAALIVFGGTIGAVMVQFPLRIVVQAFMHLKDVFLNSESESTALVENLLRYAYKARKEGILSLDSELAKIHDPFLKESLMLAIDGVSASDLRKMMELHLDYRGEKDERIPKVFEAAAGFAPTIGILGAVLGLIQVMQRLQDINEVGKGIAVAFVATIYGVGSANLLFLPWAGKLRIRIRERQVIQEMTLEAILSIIEGVNPRALEMQLSRYSVSPKRHKLEKVASR